MLDTHQFVNQKVGTEQFLRRDHLLTSRDEVGSTEVTTTGPNVRAHSSRLSCTRRHSLMSHSVNSPPASTIEEGTMH